jgi:hypothetical protein
MNLHKSRYLWCSACHCWLMYCTADWCIDSCGALHCIKCGSHTQLPTLKRYLVSTACQQHACV